MNEMFCIFVYTLFFLIPFSHSALKGFENISKPSLRENLESSQIKTTQTPCRSECEPSAYDTCSANPAVLIVGTRPEAIKMMPVYYSLKKQGIPTVLCSTGQHKDLLEGVFELFQVSPDYSFNIMKPGQDLTYVARKVLKRSQELFQKLKPSIVIVQGDTSSSFCAALAAFYEKIPVAHIEAGLRTYNRFSPFPEEVNRRMISLLASYHFSPTETSTSILKKEGIDPNTIFYTGNTVVDSLFYIIKKIQNGELCPSYDLVQLIEEQKSLNHKILLLTAHRRESFGEGLFHIFSAIKAALSRYPDLHVVYPVHPNPTIQQLLVKMGLNHLNNLSLLPPTSYQDLVYLLDQVDAIATDSGGIQEEGACLNKRVFILRNETDRPEGIENGTAFLVGTDQEVILEKIHELITEDWEKSSPSTFIYGDGAAAERIALILKEIL